MKDNLIFFLIIGSTLLFSCTNKEKYYGEWVMTPPYSQFVNELDKIIITQDSISISSFPLFNNHSESLKLNGNKLELFGSIFNIKVENDSLLQFNNSTYIKKGYPLYNQFSTKMLISIEYPKVENIDTIHNSSYSNIYFGKKLNSNEFALQLNDRITSFKDLRKFLIPGHTHSDKIDVSLTADQNSKMKDINNVFYYCRSVNVRKVKLINNIDYHLKGNNEILILEEGIYIFLNDFVEDKLIQKNDSEPVLPPPPPKTSLRTIINSNNRNIISLMNNEIYFDTQKVSKNDLSNVIEKNYTNKKYFIILYDDVSTYEHYLALMNITNKSIDEIRNRESIKIFKKPLDSLSKSEKHEMASKIPKKLINGISFNDFKKLKIDIPKLELTD